MRPYVFRGRKDAGPRSHEFTFRSSPSTRPLLRARRESTPEFMGGSKNDESKPKTFLAIEDLTDSEEADMDLSSTDESSQPPRKKRAIEGAAAATTNGNPVPSLPKWSNPDPYTALPPPDETQGKRRDFVKLIRKARIAAAPKFEDNTQDASTDDFISLGNTGDSGAGISPEGAPRAPRSFGRDERDMALGTRKRTRDDEIISPARKFRKGDKNFNLDGSMLELWRPLCGQNATPWLDKKNPPAFHLGTMLHNEVLNFYHWVKPTSYEHIIRNDLISRLQQCFEKRFFGSKLLPFGSFASGLYLPIADMDLVLLSRQFMQQNRRTICQRPRDIYSCSEFIKKQDIAIPGSIETIAHARVPIIKFVDRFTGLKVDLSFDNTSGLAANDTFQLWKSKFPEMPVIVSVIKQLLLLRGLNEVPSGGLGGFSIICLVISLLQHLPHATSEPNLGSVLMDFFHFYGIKFNAGSVGIQFDPPGYFYKDTRSLYQANKGTRLAIMDPNNPSNDISGGTKEIPRIIDIFADAYMTLKESMISAAFYSTKESNSLLGSILGANYDAYEVQREHLYNLFHRDPRFAHYHPSSPPPPPPSLSPPPLPPSNNDVINSR